MTGLKKARLFLLLPAVLALLSFVVLGAAGCQEAPYADVVTAKEGWELVRQNLGNPDFAVLDVRTHDEFAEGHIEGAINLDVNSPTFREDLSGLERERVYLVHCRSGARSSKALTVMEELGFEDVFHMEGGIIGWEREDLPLVR